MCAGASVNPGDRGASRASQSPGLITEQQGCGPLEPAPLAQHIQTDPQGAIT